MMAESDANLIHHNANGNDEEDFNASDPPVFAQKSLFGNSASLLRQAQIDELTEKAKAMNESKHDDPLDNQPADESSSFSKEGSTSRDNTSQQANDSEIQKNGLMVDDSKNEDREDHDSKVEDTAENRSPENKESDGEEDRSIGDKESDVEENRSAEEKESDGEENRSTEDKESVEDENMEDPELQPTVDMPKSLADELGELQGNDEANETIATQQSDLTEDQVKEGNDSSAIEQVADENDLDESGKVMETDVSKPAEHDDDQVDEPEAVQEVATRTPRTSKTKAQHADSFSSARRSTRRAADVAVVENETPLLSSKRATRGSKITETPKAAEKATPKSTRKSVKKENDATLDFSQTEGDQEKEEPVVETPKRGRSKVEKPAKATEEKQEDTPARTLRKRGSAVPTNSETPLNTPKEKVARQTASKLRKEKLEEDQSEVADVKTPEPKSQTRTPRTRKSVVTPAKAAESAKKEKGQDPFDFDEMADQHPEPLKNIQVEVQNFGEVRFSKVGSGKYSNTEKAAEGRMGISASTTPEKPRMSLMDLSRKEAELASITTPRSAPTRRKKVDVEEMDYETATPKAAVSKSAPPKDHNKKGRKRRSSPVLTTPKKPKIVVPELSKAEQIAVDLPSDDGIPGMLPGSRVYALYNKVFYPAIVLSSLNAFGRILVYYLEDQLTKELPESAVIPIALLSSGRLAVVQTDKEDVKVVVIDQPSKKNWDECVFHLCSIADEDAPNEAPKDYQITWQKLLLDHEDWKDYIKSKDAHATDIKAANIEDNEVKLARRSRHSAGTSASTAKTPQKAKTLKKESTTAEKQSKETIKEKASHGHSKIFAGYAFLLTSANRAAPENQIPFKKNELKHRIQQRGGTIIESVTEGNDATSILISDTYYRTQKYLAALASDMPCVSHEWIHQCVKQEKFLDFDKYVLQAGMSIVDEKIHGCKKLKGKLLKGKRVCIYSLQAKSGPNLTFTEIWEPIVRMLGADVTNYDELEGHLDYFITDPSCQPETITEAMDKGAMVLSSEWLIQTIIMGSPQDSDAHPRFAYNFSGTQS